MGALNRKGVVLVELTVPAPVDPTELRRRVADGGWVVDLRNRIAFAGGHLAGTLSFEHRPMFTTFLGWTLPWGDPITLVGSQEQVTAAVRDLSRIGIDHPGAPSAGQPHDRGADSQPVVPLSDHGREPQTRRANLHPGRDQAVLLRGLTPGPTPKSPAPRESRSAASGPPERGHCGNSERWATSTASERSLIIESAVTESSRESGWALG